MASMGLGDQAKCGKLVCKNVVVDGSGEVVTDTVRTPAGNLSLIMDGGAIYSLSDSTFSAAGKQIVSATMILTNLPAAAGSSGTLFNNGDGIVRVSP